MTLETWLPVKELPPAIRAAVASFGIKGGDIRVVRAESVNVGGGSTFRGNRAMAVAINLATGETVHHSGSWGGSNMFSRTIDDDTREHAIPANGAVVTGETGYRPLATVHVHPSNVTPALAARAPRESALTARERAILGAFSTLNSRGRKDAFAESGVTPDEITPLVDLGLVKRNRAGACQITAAGRNSAPRGIHFGSDIPARDGGSQ